MPTYLDGLQLFEETILLYRQLHSGCCSVKLKKLGLPQYILNIFKTILQKEKTREWFEIVCGIHIQGKGKDRKEILIGPTTHIHYDSFPGDLMEFICDDAPDLIGTDGMDTCPQYTDIAVADESCQCDVTAHFACKDTVVMHRLYKTMSKTTRNRQLNEMSKKINESLLINYNKCEISKENFPFLLNDVVRK